MQWSNHNLFNLSPNHKMKNVLRITTFCFHFTKKKMLRTLTSGAMKATVPSSCPWNSPAPVICVANRAAAPKSAMRMFWPVESTKMFAPVKQKLLLMMKNESPSFSSYWCKSLEILAFFGDPSSSMECGKIRQSKGGERDEICFYIWSQFHNGNTCYAGY